jgi:hypothetical protein
MANREQFEVRLMNLEGMIHSTTQEIRWAVADPNEKVKADQVASLRRSVDKFIAEAERYEKWRLEDEARQEAEYAEEEQ